MKWYCVLLCILSNVVLAEEPKQAKLSAFYKDVVKYHEYAKQYQKVTDIKKKQAKDALLKKYSNCAMVIKATVYNVRANRDGGYKLYVKTARDAKPFTMYIRGVSKDPEVVNYNKGAVDTFVFVTPDYMEKGVSPFYLDSTNSLTIVAISVEVYKPSVKKPTEPKKASKPKRPKKLDHKYTIYLANGGMIKVNKISKVKDPKKRQVLTTKGIKMILKESDVAVGPNGKPFVVAAK